MTDTPPERISAALAEIGALHERYSRTTWRVELPAVDRRSITVGIAADERTLRMHTFLLRRPDRNHEAVLERLLRKNLDIRATGPWRFAIDADGDVHALAEMPLVAVDTAYLDGVLGLLCALVDATWNGLVELGFEVPAMAPPPDAPPAGGPVGR
ncbi:MAG: type III secretion system chaperone [Miltoncostaeaceae bacterium]